MSQTLGEKLRQAREEGGLTLADVAEQTRISSLYLEAIEHDVPALTLMMSLMVRFRSRQDESFQAKVIAALRKEFGGHGVKAK